MSNSHDSVIIPTGKRIRKREEIRALIAKGYDRTSIVKRLKIAYPTYKRVIENHPDKSIGRLKNPNAMRIRNEYVNTLLEDLQLKREYYCPHKYCHTINNPEYDKKAMEEIKEQYERKFPNVRKLSITSFREWLYEWNKEEPIYFPLRRVHLCECRRLIDGGTQQYQEINIQEPTERKAPRDNSIHDEIAVQETEVPSTADDDDVKEKFTSSDEAVMQTVSSEDAERYLVSQILKSLSEVRPPTIQKKSNDLVSTC